MSANRQSTIGNRQSAMMVPVWIGSGAKLISSDMGNHFQRVTKAHAFPELLARSLERPVIIFKHSTTCPISAAAYYEMEDFEGDVVLIEVQNARELSREVEKLTGIRHESPQVLILEKGQVVWNASHRKVKALAVAEAIAGLGKQ